MLANDVDPNGDPLTAILVTGPAKGTPSVARDGSFVYTPRASFSGTDAFTYKASDGLATSTATVTITVVPFLTLSISPGTFNEAGGAAAATGTVTRRGDLSGPLTVYLTSSDTTEASVPASVTIAAGQASATFVISAVDDAVFDGTQSVTITVSDESVTSAAFELNQGVADQVAAIVPLGDGRFYTVAYAGVIRVRRFNADGTLDGSFGSGGVVQHDLTVEGDVADSAVLQPDGKLLISGHAGNGP